MNNNPISRELQVGDKVSVPGGRVGLILRGLREQGWATGALATRFGIHRDTVRQITTYKTWRE